MLDRLHERLSACGLAVDEADEVLLALSLERAGKKLCVELGLDELTEDLEEAVLDMAVGDYLMAKLSLAPQAFADWQPDVKNLRMGDVSVGYAAGEFGGRSGVFQFANGLLMRARETVAAVRGVIW